MAPKKAAAKSRSNSASSSGSAKSKAQPKAKGRASPEPKAAPAKDPDVEKAESLLNDCLAEQDITRVDGRVLDIAIGQAKPLVEKGLDATLLKMAEERYTEYRTFEEELQLKAAEMRARKDEVMALQDAENDSFATAYEAKQKLKQRVEELFDAVGDSEVDRVRRWIEECCRGGSEESFPMPPLPIDLQDHQLNTPVSEAACYGESEIVELLLENGAHPNSQNDQGRTPIWRATYNGHAEVVKLLLEKGGDPAIESKDGHPAGHTGTKETKALIDAWDKELTAERQEENLSALQRLPKPWPVLLHEAAEAGDVDAAKSIFKAINSEAVEVGGLGNLLRVVVDFDNMVDALWLSCTRGHTELCKALLEAKADADSFSNTGLTCLMIACRKGHTAIVKELLEHGAKTHYRSQQGRLASDYAREPGDGHHAVHDLVISHAKKVEDWTTLEVEAQQSQGNKACSAEVVDTLNLRASKSATAQLKAMSSEELREGGERYKQLLEERALADVLGMG
eukprot:TRINITY_DN37746_c0_g1_i1.p1 TRINITY_DN37746_c0_g1~~TRINITY_DN37746_c0_g1_i1.p1  ORF type:complete len:521 (-),score=158.47 TRINITY_DN37746_c0_g1_i1:78-1607(-)